MATLEKLKVGQVLYTITSQRAGNTTSRYDAVHSLVVKEIDLENRRVLNSWNGNEPRWSYRREVKKWRVSKPEPKRKHPSAWFGNPHP